MWQISNKFSLFFRKQYWQITKDDRLVAFFLDENYAQEYYKNKEANNGQVPDSSNGRETVRST